MPTDGPDPTDEVGTDVDLRLMHPASGHWVTGRQRGLVCDWLNPVADWDAWGRAEIVVDELLGAGRPEVLTLDGLGPTDSAPYRLGIFYERDGIAMDFGPTRVRLLVFVDGVLRHDLSQVLPAETSQWAPVRIFSDDGVPRLEIEEAIVDCDAFCGAFDRCDVVGTPCAERCYGDARARECFAQDDARGCLGKARCSQSGLAPEMDTCTLWCNARAQCAALDVDACEQACIAEGIEPAPLFACAASACDVIDACPVRIAEQGDACVAHCAALRRCGWDRPPLWMDSCEAHCAARRIERGERAFDDCLVAARCDQPLVEMCATRQLDCDQGARMAALCGVDTIDERACAEDPALRACLSDLDPVHANCPERAGTCVD